MIPCSRAERLRTSLVTLVSALVMAAVASVSAHAAPCPLGGAGSVANPFRISSEADLRSLAAGDCALDKAYLQTADITLATPLAAGVGGAGVPFTGTFDGAGHDIAGLVMSSDTADHVGLFGETAAPAFITGVNIVNASVRGDIDVGTLVGTARDTSISDSSASGEVFGNVNAGGLVGAVAVTEGAEQIDGLIASVRSNGDGLTAAGPTGGVLGHVTLSGGGDLSITDVTVTGGGSGPGIAGGVIGVVRTDAATPGSDLSVMRVRVAGSGYGASDDVGGGAIGQLEARSRASTVTLRQIDVEGQAQGLKSGGVIGVASLESGGDFSQLSSSGRVYGHEVAGGIIGRLDGPVSVAPDRAIAIADLVATGPNDMLYAGGSAGGVIGEARFFTDHVHIRRAFASGRFASRQESGVGGLVGGSVGGRAGTFVSMDGGAWDIQATGVVTNRMSNASGITTAQAKSIDTFLAMSWPIIDSSGAPAADRAWGICPRVADGYPFLLWTEDESACLDPPQPEPTPPSEPGSGSGAGGDAVGVIAGPGGSLSASGVSSREIRAGTLTWARRPALAGHRSSQQWLVSSVLVPGPGVVEQSASFGARQTACRTTRAALTAGAVSLRCRLRGPVRAAVRRSALTVRVITTYTSAGGERTTAATRVRLQRGTLVAPTS